MQLKSSGSPGKHSITTFKVITQAKENNFDFEKHKNKRMSFLRSFLDSGQESPKISKEKENTDFLKSISQYGAK